MFEDIDKAPSDVQSILLPLLEGSNTFSVGHAEVRLALLLITFAVTLSLSLSVQKC